MCYSCVPGTKLHSQYCVLGQPQNSKFTSIDFDFSQQCIDNESAYAQKITRVDSHRRQLTFTGCNK